MLQQPALQWIPVRPREWPPRTSAFHHVRRGSVEGPLALYQSAPGPAREGAASRAECPEPQQASHRDFKGRNGPLSYFQRHRWKQVDRHETGLAVYVRKILPRPCH